MDSSDILIFAVLLSRTKIVFVFHSTKAAHPLEADASDDEGIDTDTLTSLTKPELIGLVELTKDEIISKLGKKYKVILTGAENSFEGYYYESLGITIVFEYDGSVAFIECNEKVVIDGAHEGMNFSQIKEKLGEAKITETFYGIEENKGYKVEYIVGDCVLKFYSYSLDGSNSSLKIFKNRKINEIQK